MWLEGLVQALLGGMDITWGVGGEEVGDREGGVSSARRKCGVCGRWVGREGAGVRKEGGLVGDRMGDGDNA